MNSLEERGKFIAFLKELSTGISRREDLIEKYRLGDSSVEQEWTIIKKNLENQYNELQFLGIENAFLEFVEAEYCDDEDLYLLLLRYLFEMTYTPKPLLKYLEKMMVVGLDNDLDLMLLLNLEDQMVGLSFSTGMKLPFEYKWNMNQRLEEKGKRTLQLDFTKTAVEDRDTECIVVFVSQMLRDDHAPTKVVLEICRILELYLKKKVLIVNVVLKTDSELLSAAGFPCPYVTTYVEEWNGKSQREYREVSLNMYQLVLEKDNVSELSDLICEIEKLKPLCVWNFSSIPAIAGTMKEFTTSIYTSMCQGYAPVNADMIVNYIPTSDPKELENKKFLEENQTKIIETEFLFPYESPKRKVNGTELGIPEEAFVLGIVGNRLSVECDREFMGMIENIVRMDSDIYVLFIGDVTQELKIMVEQNSHNFEKYVFIGNQLEFIEHLNVLDVFVNPPRMGGGNSGAMSMSLGKPIITLGSGDIAAVAGEDFTVNSLQDYLPLVKRYKEDSSFYEVQRKRAVERIKKITMDDKGLANILQQVLDQIG
ncbi:MAG: hypothetical protein J5979_00545 [Lachnospiraceae bacterium]|nr:hypothetical protein [Lachnospiraceae bacterium]